MVLGYCTGWSTPTESHGVHSLAYTDPEWRRLPSLPPANGLHHGEEDPPGPVDQQMGPSGTCNQTPSASTPGPPPDWTTQQQLQLTTTSTASLTLNPPLAQARLHFGKLSASFDRRLA